MPQHLRDARGFLFLGIPSRHYIFTNAANDLPNRAFAVGHVYAGATSGGPPEQPRPGDGAPNEIMRPGHELRTYTAKGDAVVWDIKGQARDSGADGR
jgi:hypothetical protein